MKTLKASLLCVIGAVAVMVGGVSVWAWNHYQVPILVYHQVADRNVFSEMNNVMPEDFAWQMAFLKEHNYNVLSFDQLVAALKSGARPRHSVVITFDDASVDNYTNAFPILRHYGFPAIEFAPAGYISQRPDSMTWEQLVAMDRAGIQIGSHSFSHIYMPKLDRVRLEHEIKDSKALLEMKLGHPVNYFCYPSGGFTAEIQQMLREAGYTAACTTNRGKSKGVDLFALRRIRVSFEDTKLVFWAKASGYYNLFRKPRDSH